jgi:hypothetical protein
MLVDGEKYQMRMVNLEPFENLVDKSFLRELDRVAIQSNLNAQEPMELTHVGDFKFYLKSQNSGIH